jgi:hypothetical protein
VTVDVVEVVWLEGGKDKERQEAGGMERCHICKDNIILYAIALTKTNRLKAATIKYLKELYSKLCK